MIGIPKNNRPHMKLHIFGTANRRILNIEPQNFDIRSFTVSFSIKLAASQANGSARTRTRLSV
jgi:hypothetical protein